MQNHPALSGSRQIYSFEVSSFRELASKLQSLSRRFILLVAADARALESVELVAAAEDVIRAGASYVCCWGPDCERLHDLFDEAAQSTGANASDEQFLATTWHANEPLEEALWFALNAAFPSPAYLDATTSVIAAAVDSPEWAQQIRAYLNAGAPILA
jgi:hypothetical protein